VVLGLVVMTGAAVLPMMRPQNGDRGLGRTMYGDDGGGGRGGGAGEEEGVAG
jgi:hypothetical protein